MKDEDERGRKLQHNVQQQVWQRLSKFAHDLQVPLRLRIDVLELLEATWLGKLPRYKGVFTSWGSYWDSGSQQHGGGESFQSKSDLAALKSTELVSHLWPGRQVSSEDLVTAEAATCLFSSLLADATSMEHVSMLRSLLEEWDALFEPESGGAAESVQGNRAGETEEWGELEEWGGWEECSEELSVHVRVHVLHACWASTIERLALGGCIAEALQILDGDLVHASMALVTQDEAQQLVAKVGARNVVSCLKIALLLPYPAPQTQALFTRNDRDLKRWK
jgi:hypothetical protein